MGNESEIEKLRAEVEKLRTEVADIALWQSAGRLIHQVTLHIVTGVLEQLENGIKGEAAAEPLRKRFEKSYAETLNRQLAKISDEDPNYAAALRSIMGLPGE